MATYLEELAQKNYVPNVVIRLMGEYYSIREPDSGLSISSPYDKVVSGLNLNATTIDPLRSVTAVNQNSFKLLDRNAAISAKWGSNPQCFQGEKVEIWIGRSGVGMDFSEYLKLQDSYVSKVSKQDVSYTFSTKEAKDRLSTGAFNTQKKLNGDILAATTVITLQDVTGLPTSGLIKVNDEFFSYTGISGNDLTGCVRGEQGTTPSDHEAGSDCFLTEAVQGNPIDMLLQFLISSGGGGPYDVLIDGAGIDASLVDIAEFEDIRDNLFQGRTFKLLPVAVDSFRKFLDEEICQPLGVRLRSNNNSKIGLAVLDRAILNVDAPNLDHDQITTVPQLDVDDTKIYNRLIIEWDYFDGTGKYLKLSDYTDSDSVTQFGERPAFRLKFKGVRDALGGQSFVDDFSEIFFQRFAFPKPSVTFNAHMETSQWLMGDKPYLETTWIPNQDGELNFGDTLEVVQRAINFNTGDVRFQLAFSAFTGIHLCYIAPSDTITSVISQKVVEVGSGRGSEYRAGWKMRLYSNVTRDHEGTQVNTIASISGDEIMFVDDWVITLVATNHRIMFADYDEVTDQQKKFCFTSDGTNNFGDGKTPYQITYR